MQAAATSQLALPLEKKERKRRRIGRKLVPLGRRPAADRVGFMPHETRAEHDANQPVHVTIRRVVDGPSFRAQRVCAAIRHEIAFCKSKGVRILHYSVQENHLHLMVEAASAADLSHQMRTLFSRIAFAVNALARRHGSLFRDRHHRHALKTPREVRNALVYILFNDRKHRGGTASAATPSALSASALDRCSSAWWFRNWSPADRPPGLPEHVTEEPPITEPKTWLARWGWHRGDATRLLRFSEQPRRRLA